MSKIIKVISIANLTHDVIKIQAEKPKGLTFKVGQAADVAINKPGWEDELRAFTFTSLPSDDYVEFIIKTYPTRNSVTKQLLDLKAGDELILEGVFGDIEYKGEGIFIAGGAGITPFIAFLKHLEKENKLGNNKLLFANKTKADIVLEDYLKKVLGSKFINILSDENIPEHEHGFITADIIKKNTDIQTKYYYLCGPPPMMSAVERHLAALGIKEEQIIKEAF